MGEMRSVGSNAGQDSVRVEEVIGFDAYNQSLTGEASKTLNSKATDTDHIPCVITMTKYRYYEYYESDKSVTLKSETADIGGVENA